MPSLKSGAGGVDETHVPTSSKGFPLKSRILSIGSSVAVITAFIEALGAGTKW